MFLFDLFLPLDKACYEKASSFKSCSYSESVRAGMAQWYSNSLRGLKDPGSDPWQKVGEFLLNSQLSVPSFSFPYPFHPHAIVSSSWWKTTAMLPKVQVAL